MNLTYNAIVSEEIKSLLQDAVDDQKENLALGGGVNDYSDYRHAVGFIRGLRHAIELCDEAHKKISER